MHMKFLDLQTVPGTDFGIAVVNQELCGLLGFYKEELKKNQCPYSTSTGGLSKRTVGTCPSFLQGQYPSQEPLIPACAAVCRMWPQHFWIDSREDRRRRSRHFCLSWVEGHANTAASGERVPGLAASSYHLATCNLKHHRLQGWLVLGRTTI